MRTERRESWARAMQAGFRLFGLAHPRGVVGADGRDVAVEHRAPQRRAVLTAAHRRHHLGEKAVRIVAGNAEIGAGGLDRELRTFAPRRLYHFKSLFAGKMHDIE